MYALMHFLRPLMDAPSPHAHQPNDWPALGAGLLCLAHGLPQWLSPCVNNRKRSRLHRPSFRKDTPAAEAAAPAAIAGWPATRYEQNVSVCTEMVLRMSDPASSRPKTIATIDGWPVNVADLSEAVTAIVQSARRRESFSVFTLNLDHLDKLRRSSRFREAYAKARYITADGAPIALLAARQGARVARAPGSDLIAPLALAAAQHGVPVYLYGTTADVLTSAAAHLTKLAGRDLRIAGLESPRHGFDPEGAEANAALDRIAASGAGLCLVALGAPKQELFAAHAVERNINVGFVCIGAGLDFLAGAQTRAPAFMQRYGMEWAWRLATNPRRLVTRYARCALILAEITVLKAMKERFLRALAG
jgi:exopolysaccharide biosynthesis WecB/TagA/CpsF family protein